MGFWEDARDKVKAVGKAIKDNPILAATVGSVAMPVVAATEASDAISNIDLSQYDPTKMPAAPKIDAPTYADINNKSDALSAPVSTFGNYVTSQTGRKAPTVATPTINNADTTQSRAQQGQAIGLLQGAAMGNAPSAAEIQMRQGTENAIKAQMAAANSGRGGFNPAAIRQAQTLGAEQSQAVNASAAALRADEMAKARGMFADATNQMRGLDINQATSQAGLTLDASKANAANTITMTGMMDDLQKQFMAGGLTAGEAQLAAAKEIQRMELERLSGNADREANRNNVITNARAGVAGGLLSGVGSAATAFIKK